ncbi:hypothetical protein WY02_15310 [Pseudonocardia sp. AL041005-10]|nr:hypothetical protein WY02_15310 [Pseudonocardia sp. AL041005-10]
MPVDLLLEGSSTSDLVIAVSPAAELQSCLHALAEPEHHLELHAWIARTRRSLSEPLSRDLTRFAPLWARRRCRFLMPFAVPADVSLSTEFARVQELPADRFLVAAAHTIHGGSIDPLAVVDQPDRFVHECESRSFSRGELARELVRDAAAFKASLIDVLRRCEREFFDDEWARIAGRLRDDASTMRKVAARVPLAEAIASVSPVATVRRGGASVRFDKLQMLEVPTAGRRIVLVPSLHGTPHVVVRGTPAFPWWCSTRSPARQRRPCRSRWRAGGSPSSPTMPAWRSAGIWSTRRSRRPTSPCGPGCPPRRSHGTCRGCGTPSC